MIHEGMLTNPAQPFTFLPRDPAETTEAGGGASDPATGERRQHTAGTEDPGERVETVRTAHSPDDADAAEDVVSDPALADQVGADWTDEGGATPAGPSTATPGGAAEDDADD